MDEFKGLYRVWVLEGLGKQEYRSAILVGRRVLPLGRGFCKRGKRETWGEGDVAGNGRGGRIL